MREPNGVRQGARHFAGPRRHDRWTNYLVKLFTARSSLS
jgi:hypothetical protein